MKHFASLPPVLALVLLGPLFANPAQCQSTKNPQSAGSGVDTAGAQSEAMQMVTARAELVRDMDGRKMKAGEPFEAKLYGKVRLKNGPELPGGTVLLGTVATDDMQAGGNSKLALRFTQAKMKNGQTIPIKATIVAIAQPERDNPEELDEQYAAPWSTNTLIVDQLDAMGGADLHSRIAGQNSGVFVATKKSDVKLPQGAELTLAIAAQQNANLTGVGGGE